MVENRRFFPWGNPENLLVYGKDFLLAWGMNSERVDPAVFSTLRGRYGSHGAVALALGITPQHYRYVRKTGRMSASLRKLIHIHASFFSFPAHPQEAQPCPRAAASGGSDAGVSHGSGIR